MADETENDDIKVTDRRMFREDGEAREDQSPPPDPEPLETAEEAAGAGKDSTGGAGTIDFPSYILSYYTQGMVLLGEVPNPHTNKKEEDLEAVRQTVAILAMLQEKTKGNLAAEENQLLDSVLYELRMKYMAKTSRIKL